MCMIWLKYYALWSHHHIIDIHIDTGTALDESGKKYSTAVQLFCLRPKISNRVEYRTRNLWEYCIRCWVYYLKYRSPSSIDIHSTTNSIQSRLRYCVSSLCCKAFYTCFYNHDELWRSKYRYEYLMDRLFFWLYVCVCACSFCFLFYFFALSYDSIGYDRSLKILFYILSIFAAFSFSPFQINADICWAIIIHLMY